MYFQKEFSVSKGPKFRYTLDIIIFLPFLINKKRNKNTVFRNYSCIYMIYVFIGPALHIQANWKSKKCLYSPTRNISYLEIKQYYLISEFA